MPSLTKREAEELKAQGKTGQLKIKVSVWKSLVP